MEAGAVGAQGMQGMQGMQCDAWGKRPLQCVAGQRPGTAGNPPGIHHYSALLRQKNLVALTLLHHHRVVLEKEVLEVPVHKAVQAAVRHCLVREARHQERRADAVQPLPVDLKTCIRMTSSDCRHQSAIGLGTSRDIHPQRVGWQRAENTAGKWSTNDGEIAVQKPDW